MFTCFVFFLMVFKEKRDCVQSMSPLNHLLPHPWPSFPLSLLLSVFHFTPPPPINSPLASPQSLIHSTLDFDRHNFFYTLIYNLQSVLNTEKEKVQVQFSSGFTLNMTPCKGCQLLFVITNFLQQDAQNILLGIGQYRCVLAGYELTWVEEMLAKAQKKVCTLPC